MHALLLKAKHPLVIPLIAAALALSIYIVQHQIAGYKETDKKIEKFVTLPNGEYLRPVVLGYEQLAADIIWLQAIQVIGEDTVTPNGYDWIYHALDVVTTLDPEFSYAYQLGGVTLSVLGRAPEKSNALLLKGMRVNPDIWQIPFYIGFNNFFYLNDYGELLSSWLRHLNCQAIQHTCRNLQQDFMCRPETLMLPSSFSCGCLRRQEMQKSGKL